MSVEVIELMRTRICGGRVVDWAGGGAFSLLAEVVEDCVDGGDVCVCVRSCVVDCDEGILFCAGVEGLGNSSSTIFGH